MLRQSIIQFKPIIKPIIKPNIQKNKNFEYTMCFDGCSKGNPGLAGAGAVIYKNDEEYWHGTTFVGKKSTNNEAEYTGLIFGLQQALNMNIKSLTVKGDSQLIIRQMTGEYKCNSTNLFPFYEIAKKLEKSFDDIQFVHVLRNLNTRADELSNIALNEYLI
jgi:ribonuclease HI